MISLTFADVVIIMAVWLVASLIPQIVIMSSRRGKEFIDYSVIAFRGALMVLASTILIYRIFNLPVWITILGWLILDSASTIQTLYMAIQLRNKKNVPRPQVYTDQEPLSGFGGSGCEVRPDGGTE